MRHPSPRIGILGRFGPAAVAVLLLVAIGAVGGLYVLRREAGSARSNTVQLSYAELTGSLFVPAPANPFRPPETKVLQPPIAKDAQSVWGATGRDARGRIWIGVSTRSGQPGARLLQYDPATDQWHDRSGVLDELKAAGRYRDGAGQNKIHSKIVTGADGWLYFASSDEDGETPGKALPRWGGHLWRIHPETYAWQHLAAMPEGLVAVSGVGRHVFALGYWDHVLYRYDTSTNSLARVVVGSVGGHVSRNLLADARGHAFVPRVTGDAAELVEYDSDLKEIGATPLEAYLARGSADGNHGIVGLAYLPDGRLLFTTHRGQLHLIEPQGAGPARVTALGWFHPDGEAYAPSLFVLGGANLVGGVTRRAGKYEWVVFEVGTRISAAFPLDTKALRGVLLYGSISRDDAGRCYAVGWATDSGGGQRPLVLQITP